MTQLLTEISFCMEMESGLFLVRITDVLTTESIQPAIQDRTGGNSEKLRAAHFDEGFA